VSGIDTLRGAASGAIAAAVWAAQQPVDKRVFACRFDDVEWLGRAVTSGEDWATPGLAIHLANGAAFGALYSALAPRLAGPAWLKGPAMALAENTAVWPLTYVADRIHPGREKLEVSLWGNRRAFYQASWRHILFGVVLGELERRLNAAPAGDDAVISTVYSSNGHGEIEHVLAPTPPPSSEPGD
jgi:hypothetical protein